MKRTLKTKYLQRGFTLLELLVVIAMIGILASISVGRYSQHIAQSNRRAAIAELYAAQQQMERIRLQTGLYGSLSVPTSKGYTFDFSPNGDTYKLIAKPQASSGGDMDCGNLSIDQTDIRTPADRNECWQ